MEPSLAAIAMWLLPCHACPALVQGPSPARPPHWEPRSQVLPQKLPHFLAAIAMWWLPYLACPALVQGSSPARQPLWEPCSQVLPSAGARARPLDLNMRSNIEKLCLATEHRSLGIRACRCQMQSTTRVMSALKQNVHPHHHKLARVMFGLPPRADARAACFFLSKPRTKLMQVCSGTFVALRWCKGL